MAYGFPGVSEQAVCATHEQGLVLRRELEPGRALVATVRRFDTVPGPADVALNELKSGVSFENSEEGEYFRNRVAELGAELESALDTVLLLRQFLDQNGLADPTIKPAEPAEPSSRVE